MSNQDRVETLEELRRLTSPFPESEAVKAWKAQGRKAIGYVCIYTPEEILYAAGILPFRITGDNEELELKKAESYLYINTCSFARTCFQLALDGGYSFLDGLVTGETCDGARRLHDVWKHYLSPSFEFVFGVPRKFTERAYHLYGKDLQEFRERLEAFVGTPITDQALRHAIQVYNHTRDLLQRLYELRKRPAPPISGAETLEVVKAAMRMPRDQYNQLLERLLAELERGNRRIEKPVRLMVNGSILSNSGFIRGIEELQAVVVTDELCTGTRYFWERVEDGGRDPWEAITRYYLGRPPCARFQPSEKRFDHVREMVKQFGVDGIITEIVRYCVPYAHDEPLLKERLKGKNVPILELDLEYGQGSSGQIRTRAEAFIEMIENLKAGKGIEN